MKGITLTLTLLASTVAFSQTDYSACNQGLATGRITKDGKIQEREGLEKIVNRKETKEGVEVTFEGSDPRVPYKEKIFFHKDEQGRITGYTHDLGYTKLSKKEKEQIKYNEAYKLANGHYPGECLSSIVGDGWRASGISTGDCSNVYVFDENGNKAMLDYNTVTKKNFNEKKMGMTWEQFSELKAAYQRTIESKKKLAKAYMGFMDDKGWLFPTGEQAKFKVDESKCAVEKVDKLLVNAVNNTIMPHNEYDAEKCSILMPKIKNAQQELMACSMTEKNLARDILGIPEGAIFISLDEMPSSLDSIPKSNRDIINRMYDNCNIYGSMTPVASAKRLTNGAKKE